MMLIDAHQHYWQVARGDYGWLHHAPTLLRRDFLPADFRMQREAIGIHGSILVQAAPTESETRFLLELSEADRGVVGVVGWVDFEAHDVHARIKTLVRDGNGRLLGLRPMVQDIPDPDWLARPALDAAFDAMQEYDLAFDALVQPIHIPALRKRLAREHSLRTVLDHAGKPDIAHGDFDDWAAHMAHLAEHPTVYCKLSGLLTQLVPGTPESAMDRYVEHLFACFSANRLMWGSDWPVLTTHSDVAHWLMLARDYTQRFAPDAQPQIFGGNVLTFYKRSPDILSPESVGAAS
ncbi:MAG: amidohydrolase family protein [Rhodanobacter sp.]